MYNETESREIHFAINGRNSSRGAITLTGVRCVSNCVEEIEDKELEDRIRFWDEPLDWEFDPPRLPMEDEDIQIPSGWNMYMNVANAPKLNHLQINGRLTFQ